MLFFGVLGWIMKRQGWPRPPLILGVVLGDIVERYLFISVGRYGTEWLLRPVVMVVFAFALWGLARPLLREVRAAGGIAGMFSGLGKPRFDVGSIIYLGFIGFLLAMVIEASTWPFDAKITPMIVGCFAVAVSAISLINHTLRQGSTEDNSAQARATRSLHLDLKADTTLKTGVMLKRAAVFLAWLLTFVGLVAMIGMLPTAGLFVILYMRLEGNEKWTLVLPIAAALTIFTYALFDQLLSIPWPRTVIGGWFPALKDLIPSL